MTIHEDLSKYRTGKTWSMFWPSSPPAPKAGRALRRQRDRMRLLARERDRIQAGDICAAWLGFRESKDFVDRLDHAMADWMLGVGTMTLTEIYHDFCNEVRGTRYGYSPEDIAGLMKHARFKRDPLLNHDIALKLWMPRNPSS